MKLLIENIAKIREASIEIDGITVIAGSNNAGKSTIGKALYCMFDSFSRIDEFVRKNKPNDARKVLSRNVENLHIICKQLSGYKRKKTGLSENLQEKYADYLAECDTNAKIEEVMNSFCMQHLQLYDIGDLFDNDEVQSWLKEAIADVSDKMLEYDSEYAIKSGIEETFRDVFGNQIATKRRIDEKESTGNVKSKVTVQINRNDRDSYSANMVEFKEERVVSVEQDFSVNTKALYIENPNVLHYFQILGMVREQKIRQQQIEQWLSPNSEVVKNYLKMPIFFRGFQKMDLNQEILVERKQLDEIIEKINRDIVQNVQGTIDFREGEWLQYQDDAYAGTFRLDNLSTGLKSIALLQCILNYRVLKNKSVLILDEPEIHLHPEWQVQYAKYIVNLQKNLDLHIVITTHSPFFVKAIENASLEEDNYDKCHYYYTDLKNGEVSIENVDYDKEMVYAKMMKPLMDMIGDMGL
mgnify:FL=1|jgi:predicted ATPase